jgi:hypothetical protein
MLSDKSNEIRRNLKRHRPGVTLASIFVIALVCYLIIRADYNSKLSYSFSGVVTKVVYNRNNYPVVTINRVDYELSFDGWDCNDHKIDIGDKMIKKKGNMTLLLIKVNGRDTVDLLYKIHPEVGPTDRSSGEQK